MTDKPEARQGLADWSRETPSDDMLSPEVRERLERAWRAWLDEHFERVDRDEPGP